MSNKTILSAASFASFSASLWHLEDVSTIRNWSSLATNCCFSTSTDLNESSITDATSDRPQGGGGGGGGPPFPLWHMVLFGCLACCIGIVTVGGNLIVILSFVVEKSIRQPTNYFIASLAVSDLLIGSISMPLYTVYLLSGQKWPLGEALCDLWLSIDYTACLCSIYTVFCITADRFCSVKLPAKYRKWRTGRKVVVIVCLTWTVPMAVFFTSIFGWQHFVGRRTVPRGRCYVQYMEDALFNCFLQIGYFWITLTAMFVLYAGIYRVALDLHRRSAAQREKTMSCLVSMAGRTVTQIGSVISISRNPCRLEGFALRTEADPLDARLNRDQSEKQRWNLTAPTNSERRQRDHRGSDPFAHPDLSLLPFLLGRSEINHAETNQKPKPGASDHEAVDSHMQLDASISECESRTKDSKDSKTKDQSGGTEQLKLNIPRITVSDQPFQTTEAADAMTIEPKHILNLSYIDDESVQRQVSPTDHVTIESEAHEFDVLLPNPESESGICPRRLNRFRLIGAGKQLKPVEQKSRLLPIIEIEMQTKRDGSDSAPDTQSIESNPDELPASKSSKCDDASGSSADDDSDDTALRHRHSTMPGATTSQASAGCVMKAPHHQLQQQLQHLQPVAKLIRYGLRSRHSSESRSAQLQQMRSDNRTRKALRTITLILGAFVICWIPWHILSLIIGFCHERNACVRPILYDISYWLCYLNSPINPFCYAFANQQFKKTFIRIIRLDWRRNN